jgi:hypothetical protein
MRETTSMKSDWLSRRNRSEMTRREQRLMPIGWALVGVLGTGLIITASVVYVGLKLLHFRHIQQQPVISESALFDLLKIGFAVTAGIGAVIALVTAYRKQRIEEFTHNREEMKLFNERFATAAGQLGHESVAVRLAGAHAMAGLADDWPDQRQTCVDVLCAYLRIPYEMRPSTNSPESSKLVWETLHEVRHTIMRIKSNHLEPDRIRLPNLRWWRDINLELSGATFDGGEFAGAQFDGGSAFFVNAKFIGSIDFSKAKFMGPGVFFENAQFFGDIDFSEAEFHEGAVSLTGRRFISGTAAFRDSTFKGGVVSFMETKFEGANVDFTRSVFSGSFVSFANAQI